MVKEERAEERASAGGALYLCATPIGNLEDMTYRAVRVLKEVDLIAAEDTRHTRRLLAHFDIHTPLTSYHEHNKEAKGAALIEKLKQGAFIACVSDAGLPGISDPGSLLARQAVAAGIRVVPLPGANAALTALIASGLDTSRFTFVGFLPRSKAKRTARLAEVAGREETLLFYEAPHHLLATLEELLAALGDREAALGRELTKKFEEFHRGRLTELLNDFSEKEPRGEFVIVVGGEDSSAAAGAERMIAESGAADDALLSPVKFAARLVAAGHSPKEAARETAKRLGISRRAVYQALLGKDEEERGR